MRRMELDAGIKNIMVIVPHEDDEILLAAGIMENALAKGIGVHVVMAGNGDYEGHDEATGSVRLPETLAGLQVLGLDGRQVTFLGYADTGMDETESFLRQLYDDSEETVYMCRTVRIIRMRFLTRKIIMRKSMENLLCIQEINLNRI